MSNVTGLFKRGTTYNLGTDKTLSSTYGQSVGIEGHVAVFTDEDVTVTAGAIVAGGGVRTKRSDRLQKCVVVRNVSGGALLPCRLVTWQSGYYGRRVDGYVRLTNAVPAGVVDERLPAAGVPNYDLFWLQVQGPCLVQTAASAIVDIVQGDPLTAVTCANSTGTTGAATAGRVQKLVGSATTTDTGAQLLAAEMGRFATAISGCTSTGTDSKFLADINCMNV
jgi:hypothetical protein